MAFDEEASIITPHRSLSIITEPLSHSLSSLLPHAPSLHPLHPLAESCLDNLPLLKILRILEVSLVSKFLEMTRLVHFAFETTQCRFDGFSLADLNFDVDIESRGYVLLFVVME